MRLVNAYGCFWLWPRTENIQYYRTSNNSLHQIFMFFIKKNKFVKITYSENG